MPRARCEREEWGGVERSDLRVGAGCKRGMGRRREEAVREGGSKQGSVNEVTRLQASLDVASVLVARDETS